MTTLAQRITALQSATVNELAAKYTALFGKAPRTKNAAFLRRNIAWKLQERELGGLSDRARTRLDELVAKIDLPLRDAPPPRPRAVPRTETHAPMVGTVLTRRWHDQDIRVTAVERGYEWNGVVYGSLSAVAKAITGAGWSGALFFGLKQRRAAQ